MAYCDQRGSHPAKPKRNLNMDFQAILTEAHAAASKAQEGMVENMNALDCGFAWVVVDGMDPLARACRKAIKAKAGEYEKTGIPRPADKADQDMRGFWGSKGYPTGWQFWSPGHAPVQAVGIHEAGAKAFALKLGEYGIRAEWRSRLD